MLPFGSAFDILVAEHPPGWSAAGQATGRKVNQRVRLAAKLHSWLAVGGELQWALFDAHLSAL